MSDDDIVSLRAAIAALEGQRATLGDAVLELALAPLRARLATLQRPAGLRHRHVAVLFADVVGSTAMAGSLQVEDAMALVGGMLRRMADIVEAHHGRVLRFTGDGVKAAFGMDETREDDAERAVRAGLAILAAGREQAEAAARRNGITDFAVRVGVHSGDVALGAGVEDDNTAMGAAVNIAARMEQAAPPGALRISFETWSHVRGLFDVEAQPPLQVKGLAAPMQTYHVRGALERSTASVERGLQGLRTPMVGRDAELQRLLDTAARARQTRQLQALMLLGDAGLGKSRLLRELTTALAGSGQQVQVLALRSQPDGLLRPWGLLRSILATKCLVADTDSAEVARRKVVDGLAPWFAERAEQQAQMIGHLSGLDFGDSPHLRGLDPRSLRDQAFAALRVCLQAWSAPAAPLLLVVVEDLHWADDSSLDLLQHLLAHAAELPLALVMTARPALLARRPDWSTPEGAGQATVRLSPLAAADSGALALALLRHIDPLPARLTELIVGRAEGNPYYMEELVRRLVDDGVIDTAGPRWTVQADRLDKLRLPGTLVGLLQARLDALPGSERQAARLASVIGHVFWDDALLALDANAPQALPALQRSAFVKDRQASDFEGTPERQFDHHLLHQVTYDTLLKAERKLGHGAAARWLAERTQGRGAEFLAMTGEHAERAGDTALAIDCFAQAGFEAEGRFANSAAVAWTRRALALLGEADPARRFDLLSRLDKIADNVGDRSGQDALITEMTALLERYPDDTRQAELLFTQCIMADRRDQHAAMEALARQSFAVAERGGVAYWAAMSQAMLAWAQFVKLDYPGAFAHLDIALPWAGKIEPAALRAEIESQLLTVSAMVSTAVGRHGKARSNLLAVFSRGETLKKPRLQLGALDGLAQAAASLGRWDELVDWSERMRALAVSTETLSDQLKAQAHLADAAMAMNDHAAAVGWLDKSLALNRAGERPSLRALTFQRLGASHLELGDAVTALRHCNEALIAHESLNELTASCLTMALKARCQLQLGQAEQALSGVNQALQRMQTDLADRAAHETTALRWTCHQVLDTLGDARAAPMLAQLYADVQASAAERTDAGDTERLIQALPVYRDIVAAYQGFGAPPVAG